MEQKYDVFISYSRRDYVDEKDIEIPDNPISQITRALDAAGISYWFDKKGEYSGEAFVPIITQAIKNSDVFLFIASKNANQSRWTSNEIATANTYQKKIIPLKLDSSQYNDSIILYLATLDFIEYKKNPTVAIKRVIKSVSQYLADKKAKEDRLKEQEAQEKARQEAETKRKQQIADKEQRLADVCKKLQAIEEQIQLSVVQQAKLKQEEDELIVAIAQLKGENTNIKADVNPNIRKKRIIINIIVSILMLLAIGSGLFAYFRAMNEGEEEPILTISQNTLLGEEDKSANISQWPDTTPSIKIKNLQIEQDVRREGKLGMIVQVFMETAFLKDCPCTAQAFFSNKTQIITDTTGNAISIWKDFTPLNTISNWSNFKLFIPYDTFSDLPQGEYNVLIGVRALEIDFCSAASKPHKFQYKQPQQK
jgi:hypothetical protein